MEPFIAERVKGALPVSDSPSHSSHFTTTTSKSPHSSLTPHQLTDPHQPPDSQASLEVGESIYDHLCQMPGQQPPFIPDWSCPAAASTNQIQGEGEEDVFSTFREIRSKEDVKVEAGVDNMQVQCRGSGDWVLEWDKEMEQSEKSLYECLEECDWDLSVSTQPTEGSKVMQLHRQNATDRVSESELSPQASQVAPRPKLSHLDPKKRHSGGVHVSFRPSTESVQFHNPLDPKEAHWKTRLRRLGHFSSHSVGASGAAAKGMGEGVTCCEAVERDRGSISGVRRGRLGRPTLRPLGSRSRSQESGCSPSRQQQVVLLGGVYKSMVHALSKPKAQATSPQRHSKAPASEAHLKDLYSHVMGYFGRKTSGEDSVGSMSTWKTWKMWPKRLCVFPFFLSFLVTVWFLLNVDWIEASFCILFQSSSIPKKIKTPKRPTVPYLWDGFPSSSSFWDLISAAPLPWMLHATSCLPPRPLSISYTCTCTHMLTDTFIKHRDL